MIWDRIEAKRRVSFAFGAVPWCRLQPRQRRNGAQALHRRASQGCSLIVLAGVIADALSSCAKQGQAWSSESQQLRSKASKRARSMSRSRWHPGCPHSMSWACPTRRCPKHASACARPSWRRVLRCRRGGSRSILRLPTCPRKGAITISLLRLASWPQSELFLPMRYRDSRFSGSLGSTAPLRQLQGCCRLPLARMPVAKVSSVPRRAARKRRGQARRWRSLRPLP